jgi:hypothetical protein
MLHCSCGEHWCVERAVRHAWHRALTSSPRAPVSLFPERVRLCMYTDPEMASGIVPLSLGGGEQRRQQPRAGERGWECERECERGRNLQAQAPAGLHQYPRRDGGTAHLLFAKLTIVRSGEAKISGGSVPGRWRAQGRGERQREVIRQGGETGADRGSRPFSASKLTPPPLTPPCARTCEVVAGHVVFDHL